MNTVFSVRDYDLVATLGSGQTFRWRQRGAAWEGVIGGRWVRLEQPNEEIRVTTAEQCSDWSWLAEYLQTAVDLTAVLRAFPDDEPLRSAVAACRGLRLLRQEPWECLASFILSATKQIVQIQQIVALLCQRFGDAVAVPPGHEPMFGFPSAARLAACTEGELRACKMGFRAPKLLASARMIAAGEVDLAAVRRHSCEGARAELLRLPGVGPKIADCVLLFAYGFPEAFPVDVWVNKALQRLYFPRRRPTKQRLHRFIRRYFGPQAGYAQQYLFHYARTTRLRDQTGAGMI